MDKIRQKDKLRNLSKRQNSGQVGVYGDKKTLKKVLLVQLSLKKHPYF